MEISTFHGMVIDNVVVSTFYEEKFIKGQSAHKVNGKRRIDKKKILNFLFSWNFSKTENNNIYLSLSK